jgi:excisionase family DNA binding protein
MNDSHDNLLLPERIAVTVKEAAELVGTNQKQIRRALYSRELQATKLGKSYSIAVEDLRKWFDSKKGIL